MVDIVIVVLGNLFCCAVGIGIGRNLRQGKITKDATQGRGCNDGVHLFNGSPRCGRCGKRLGSGDGWVLSA